MKADLKKIQQTHFEGFQDDKYDAKYVKVLEILKKRRPLKILDIGCAKGSFLQHLKELGWTCVGVDICASSVKAVKDKGMAALQSDVSEGLPFENGSFDCIFAGEVIEHLADTDFFLQECGRVLKDGGTLILTTPNLSFLVNRILLLFGKEPVALFPDFHLKYFTKKVLLQFLERNGFKVETAIGDYILFSQRRLRVVGLLWEKLGYYLPTLSAHLIVFALKK